MATKIHSATKKYDSMSYFSLESTEHSGEAGLFHGNWRQNLFPQSMISAESSHFQGSMKTGSKETKLRQPDIDEHFPTNSDLLPTKHCAPHVRKVDSGCESQAKQTRDRKDFDKQIEQLTPPPPAQLRPHVVKQFSDSNFQSRRPSKEERNVSMNFERHKMRPFRLNALKRVEESEII